jgi:hypothetical protein
MGIGTSDGEYYADAFDYHLGIITPPQEPLGSSPVRQNEEGVTTLAEHSGLQDLQKKASELHGGDIVTRIPYSERIGSGDAPSTNIDDRRGRPQVRQIFSPNAYGFHSDMIPGTDDRQAQIHKQMIENADQQARTANHRVESGEINPVEGKGYDQLINHDHHVPLVASALTDDGGNMYGVAVDHRVDVPKEYLPHLIEHERSENSYMNDLIKDGYSSQDAYHKAHDWATQRESAAVIGQFGRKGQEDYKQFFRDAAGIASQPSDMDRHPHAHTTRHGLDESELAMNFDDIKKKIGEVSEYLNPTPKVAGGEMAAPDRIASPAIMSKEGKVFTGINHGDAWQNLEDAGHTVMPATNFAASQGFLTSKGRFVSREQAVDIAEAAKQINTKDSSKPKTFMTKKLISEDLDPANVENIRELLKEYFGDPKPRK